MTERALLVKSCFSEDGRYYALGFDLPHVRVFDTQRGALCAHMDLAEKVAADRRANLQSALGTVEATHHDRAREVAALRGVKLTAMTIGSPAVVGDSALCAAGLSDGTVLAVRLAGDKVLYHAAASEAQQPVVALALSSRYLFALSSNRQLHILDAGTGHRLVVGIPVPANTASLSVRDATQDGATVDVMIGGITTLIGRVHVPTHRSYARIDSTVSIGGAASGTTFAYLGEVNGTAFAVTSAAAEGVVRIWDVSPAAGPNGRCCHVLLCGHRVLSVSVFTPTGTVAVTTVAGQVLLWQLDIVRASADLMPSQAQLALASTTIPPSGAAPRKGRNTAIRGVATSKLLSACLVTGARGECGLVLTRGGYATPVFDGVPAGAMLAKNLAALDVHGQRQAAGTQPDHAAFVLAPGMTCASPLCGNVSFNPHEAVIALVGAGGHNDEESDEDVEQAVGAGWATHTADAHRATITAAEEFAKPVNFRAENVKALPTASGADKQQGAVGLAVVPLYQALHANDKALVMELVSFSSRSEGDIAATVRRLELPYALQLLNILTERLVQCGAIDHPFHAWVAAIMRLRGSEMRDAETLAALRGMGSSVPKDFFAPVQQHYRQLVSMQDRLAVLWGRMSVFKAVRPRDSATERRTRATIAHGTIGADPAIFPLTLREIRQKTRSGAVCNKLIRVQMKDKRRTTTDAREEKVRARKEATKREEKVAAAMAASDDDQAMDEAEAEEMDMLEDLDDMNLDSDASDVEGAEGAEEDAILDGSDVDSEDGSAFSSSGGDADDLLDSEDELAEEGPEGSEDGSEESSEDSDDDGGNSDRFEELLSDDDESDGGDGGDSEDDVVEALGEEAGRGQKRSRRMRTD